MYLNLDLNYPDHPKTRRLVALLGKHAEYCPVRLWLYVGRLHPERGRLPGYSASEIESIAGWDGEPGAFISAMEKVNWLKKDEKNEYNLKNWKEHQGHLAAFKRRGKTAAKARWDKDKEERALSMQKAMLDARLCNAPTNQPTNQPTEVEDADSLLEKVVTVWNSYTALPHIRGLSNSRKLTILRRLKEKTWRDDWQAAIEKISLSAFCLGKNDRGWRADFDWFVKPDSLNKIMEGRYDNRESAAPPSKRDTQTEIQNLMEAFKVADEKDKPGIRAKIDALKGQQ